MLPLVLLVLTQSPLFRPMSEGPIYADGTMGGLAFFEFAPLSGQGMSLPCACTAVTGAKGEALTFTRASTATCTKGNTTASIANGDLVTCAAAQPRVMPGGDGTGVLGLLVESSRVNSAIQSQALDNAAWTKTSAGAGAVPTVTADFAVAPDGTTTAERVQFSACPAAGDESAVTSGVISLSPASSSVFVKGNGTSGSISMCIYQGSLVGACSPCAFNSSTWTRCVKENLVSTGGNPVWFGCENRTTIFTGASNTGAADVLVWGAQAELGAYATSYIPTTTVAVTRAGETASVAIASAVRASGSLAFTSVTTAGSLGFNAGWVVTAGPLVGNFRDGFVGFSSAAVGSFYSNATQGFANAVITAAGVNRHAGYWGAGGNGFLINGSGSTAAGVADTVATAWVNIGSYQAVEAVTQPGVYKAICVDPDPSRCR